MSTFSPESIQGALTDAFISFLKAANLMLTTTQPAR
jgi:hypothetical protein